VLYFFWLSLPDLITTFSFHGRAAVDLRFVSFVNLTAFILPCLLGGLLGNMRHLPVVLFGMSACFCRLHEAVSVLPISATTFLLSGSVSAFLVCGECVFAPRTAFHCVERARKNKTCLMKKQAKQTDLEKQKWPSKHDGVPAFDGRTSKPAALGRQKTWPKPHTHTDIAHKCRNVEAEASTQSALPLQFS